MSRMTVEHERFAALKLQAKGRNGFMHCRGVEVTTLYYGESNHVVMFNPLVSSGATSDAARIEIPAEALPRLISVLKSAHSEHIALKATDPSNLLNNFVCPECKAVGSIEEQDEDCTVTTNIDLMKNASDVEFGYQDIQSECCGHYYCSKCGHNIQTENGEAVTSLEELEEHLMSLGGTR